MNNERPATNRYLDHPERQDDEVFLGLDNGTVGGEVVWYFLIQSCKTVRKGNPFVGGEEYMGEMERKTITPVFEKKSEIREHLKGGNLLGKFSTLVDPEMFEAVYTAEEIKGLGIKLGKYRR